MLWTLMLLGDCLSYT